MKKIGILPCRKVGLTCTGAGCFKVYNEKLKFFERYKDEDVQLSVFFDCSGCEADKKTDAGFLKKMRRLKENDIEIVHLSQCIGDECPHRNEIIDALKNNEIEIVEGTH